MQYDPLFLKALDGIKVKKSWIRMTLLDFQENPIREIQGVAQSGSVNVSGSSAVRRTINLTLFADESTNNLENLDNLISINKKIKIEVGIYNPLIKYKEQYGEVIWFPQGIYVIASASLSRSTSGMTISISGKDKMVKLDGTVGGTLPASVIFHEIENKDTDGNIYYTYPTIYQIIEEAVNHYGEEPVKNIVIADLDKITKQVVKYIGDYPIYFNSDNSGFSFEESDLFPNEKVTEEDVGYFQTDFTYPGELILSAGETVVSLLDKIVQALGNYEYYYDLDGKFIFQEKKNYVNTSYSHNITDLVYGDYISYFSNDKYAYSLDTFDTVVSLNKNPQYDNFKNDFIVWGTRTVNDIALGIRYHLAIDDKPLLDLAKKYGYVVKDIQSNRIIRYEFVAEKVSEDSLRKEDEIGQDNIKITQDSSLVPSTEWREELYRRALVNQAIGGVEDAYDQELIAEWRKLYDLSKWDEGWNPDVKNDPGSLDYWLDFIDTSSELGKYSVKNIGRRTKAINSDKVTAVYYKEIPDIIFLENPGDLDVMNKQIKEFQNKGQRYCYLNESQMELFDISSRGVSCYDNIRELLYQNLNYNTSISLTCSPKYYLEPNNLIYIKDKETNTYGTYEITQFSLPLSYNGTMSISAVESLSRV